MSLIIDLTRLLTTPFVLYLKLLTFKIAWIDIPRTYPSWIILFLYWLILGVFRYTFLDGMLLPTSVLLVLLLSLAFSVLVFGRAGILQILAVGSVDFLCVVSTLLFSRFGFVYSDYWLAITIFEIFCFLRLYHLFLRFRRSEAKDVDIFV